MPQQIAGLDFGWGNPQEMEWDDRRQRFTLERSLPCGTYPFKCIFDGRWSVSTDHRTFQVLQQGKSVETVEAVKSEIVTEKRLP